MAADTPTQDILVEVTLTTGAVYSSRLEASSPVLHDLHLALATQLQPTGERQVFLIQLPTEGGHTACSFLSSAVVSLRTTPPVLLQPAQTVPTVAQQALAPTNALHKAFVRIDDFLTPDENRQLYSFATEGDLKFEASVIIGDAVNHRQSKVFYGVRETRWNQIFLGRLKVHLPHIMRNLGLPPFKVGRFEIQLTASNDGDFFKLHADASHEKKEVSSRRLTYVYYLHREPKPFKGGGLIMYRAWPDPSNYATISDITKIEPANNCLIAFRSDQPHELDLVRCPTRDFSDSRFTINGWLHPAVA